MNWQPTLSWEDAKKKALILRQIRSFFDARDVIEVETPVLGQSTVTDIHLDAFTTEFTFLNTAPKSSSSTLFLQTSPEYCMKRLLASGYQSIYQLSKAFRHEPKGRFHNPEFTLLEWYRLGFKQIDLINEVALLLISVLQCKQPKICSYQALFIEHTGIDPLDTELAELKTYIAHKNKMSDWLDAENNQDTLLQFILSEVIEPVIGINEPIFIMNFPASQASLAKISDADHRVAERFECYFKGIELVNGFCELTDAAEQLKRFEQDNINRKAAGEAIKAIDPLFISALEAGMPQCSGVAMGIDRLLMLALDKRSIDEVITFAVDRA